GAGASGKPQPDVKSPSSVWRVDKGNHHIYIAGTIHLLREADYPLPKVFELAYADSAKLVFELPPGSDADTTVATRMRELGMYKGSEELSQNISPATMAKVRKWAAEKGLSESVVNKFRPWFLALTISATEYQTLGADPARGVDTYFEKMAREDKKPGEGLETVEFQLGIFAKLDAKLQEDLLEQTFTESETLPKDFDELIVAWRKGEKDKLQEFLFRDADKYPVLLEEFLLKRNQAWIAPIEKYLAKRERVMILVGAGHLGGKGGVLSLLEAKGCTVTQVTVPQ
ncbi:MAG: TraB/GumN family protein, partial [Verrucomicrobium sp.]|nr:TraB/GumN family protein [Verrucomicrobium sp.]